MAAKINLRAGTPDDANRTYLPEEIIGTDIVVNENGNNSQPWPERLTKHTEVLCEGIENTWYEYVPESCDPEKKVPLVVSLHGGLMTGWGQCIYSSWSYVADREGFIVVYPDATSARFWMIEGMFDQGDTPTEIDGVVIPRAPKDYRENHDLNFLRALIETMKSRYNIDESRIFMQGMSMGNLMTAQFSRYYGNILAGAAGAAACTWAIDLFEKDGSLKNVAGPVAAWQTRPENNGFGMTDYEGQLDPNNINRYYWLKINGCNPLPEISIIGEDNFAFYKGEKADLVYLDIKNRDHGQTLDEAFLYWDYFFSGLRRLEDGSIETTTPNIERKGDQNAAAFTPEVPAVWWQNRRYELTTAPIRWNKLKYHGLNGGEVVRGSYLMVPVSFLAQMAGAAYKASEDTLKSEITLPDGRVLVFARGSIGCLIDDQLRCMDCEAIHRNGELLISVSWFAKAILGWQTSECNDVLYATDHWAELSYYAADVIKSILKDEYSFEDFDRLVKRIMNK